MARMGNRGKNEQPGHADSNPRRPFRPYSAPSIWAPRHMHRGAHSQVHPGAGCMGALVVTRALGKLSNTPRRPLTHVATGWPGVVTRVMGKLSNTPRYTLRMSGWPRASDTGPGHPGACQAGPGQVTRALGVLSNTPRRP